MALTALDPNTLLIVDLQKGIIGSPLIHPIGEAVERACAPTDGFRRLGETGIAKEIIDLVSTRSA
jgi:hypothetical protein